MEVLDKAKYHSEGDFPAGLLRSQAYLPGGMFVAWCALNGLLSVQICDDFKDECEDLASRRKSPCSLYRAFGGVFLDSHLNEKGSSFAKFYFDFECGAYLDDFIEVLAEELPSVYHVADDWGNYDKLSSIINRHYRDWVNEER